MMKKTVSLLLVLCLSGICACALAALPEGYVYEPWRGDKGGVIAAEISRLNDKGVVKDKAAMEALPPSWQKGSALGTMVAINYAKLLEALLRSNGGSMDMLGRVIDDLLHGGYLQENSSGNYSSQALYEALQKAIDNGDWPPR